MKIYILLFLISWSICVSAQDCTKCDSSGFERLIDDDTNLNQIDVDRFLCTLGSECEPAAEFMEYSNEVLFYIVGRYPHLFLSSLLNKKELSYNFIIDQLSRPINDGINIKKTISSIRSVHGYSTTKKKVLSSLRKAIPKKR